MSDDDNSNPPPESVPTEAPPASQSMELPAVIMGERGEEEEEPRVRILPGRVPKYYALYPAYAATGLAALVATHFSLASGEWHPLMTLVGWGLLFCWYWVYGVAYRYRRRLMKWFALSMSTLTAGSLVLISAVRATSMVVPDDGSLIVRNPQPLLIGAVVLTTLSLAAVFTHAIYLGRGYRQKEVNDDNEGDRDIPSN